MGKVILGSNVDLVKAMQEAGILPDNCRRVVIDIPYDDVVTVYYECVGDTRLLDVDIPKHLGVMIREVKKAQKEDSLHVVTEDTFREKLRKDSLING